jgi:hypothetical protein
MKKEFLGIYRDVYQNADTSRLQAKYLSASWLFNRAWKHLRVMRRLNLTKGLDFGCGAAGTVVLGKLTGIEITGMDIPFFSFPHAHAGPNPFRPVQEYLKSHGHRIVIRETMDYPWKEFRKRSFDCIVSFNSIDSDYSDKSDSNRFGRNSDSMRMRLKELSRISKKNAIWIIGGKSRYWRLRRSKFFRRASNRKRVELILCT